MKRYLSHLTTIAALVAVSMYSSCTKGFTEANTDPNTSESALPQALLAPAITKVVSYNMSRAQRVGNELMQVTINMGDTEGKIFRYEIRTTEADYLWNNWYVQLTNFKSIYDAASNPATLNVTYQGIALICRAWVFSMLTDTYGDIPYFHALEGRDDNVQPSFDAQKDIYTDLFDQLEQANTLLKSGGNISATADPVYGGNAASWRRFGNSLYLRLLLRLSNKAEVADQVKAKIKQMIDEAAGDYPLITSNVQSAVLKWTGTAPYVSPFATWRGADWYGPKAASFFADNLVDWGDPRLATWLSKSEGEYAGVPGGYAPGDNPQPRSAFPTTLQSEPLLGNILNYSEVQFMLAELAVRGIVTSQNAQTCYETGIINGITYWGFTVPENYLNNPSIAWDEDYSAEAKMLQIHLQKYYALFFTDLESWFEYRRTGIDYLPKGKGLRNGGVMPARLNYPVYLQAANGENYRAAVTAQGADVISTQVWWQKP